MRGSLTSIFESRGGANDFHEIPGDHHYIWQRFSFPHVLNMADLINSEKTNGPDAIVKTGEGKIENKGERRQMCNGVHICHTTLVIYY